MAILKAKEIAKMSMQDIDEKFKELKNELIKAKAGKGSKTNPKEIKKTMARLLTIKNMKQELERQEDKK